LGPGGRRKKGGGRTWKPSSRTLKKRGKAAHVRGKSTLFCLEKCGTFRHEREKMNNHGLETGGGNIGRFKGKRGVDSVLWMCLGEGRGKPPAWDKKDALKRRGGEKQLPDLSRKKKKAEQ